MHKPELQESLASKEWIVTNGLGSYASSTVHGCNTRRYHGLLVASFNPPTDRKVLVSKLDETVHTGDEHFELGTNNYSDVIHPNGYQYFESFERDPFPKTIWGNNQFSLSKTVFMVYGRNTTVIGYKNEGRKDILLELNPMLNYRDYHGLLQENPQTDFYTEPEEGYIKIHPEYGSVPVYITHDGEFVPETTWFKDLFYEKEAYRGLDASEDLCSIGTIRIQLKAGQTTYVSLSLRENAKNQNFGQWQKNETGRLNNLKTSENKFINDLLVSANQFVVNRKSTDSHSLLAGYHWFTDWGRDTMIAVIPLCIETGKQEVSKSILQTFLKYIDKGMLPNRFPDSETDEPEYNTIDATLWLFVVLYKYHQQFDDADFVEETMEDLSDIIRHHINGTRFNIHQTSEGFIFGGKGISQLTWMDARVGDKVVTPRHGCPVEIQALWYNALKIYTEFEKDTGVKTDLSEEVQESAKKLKKNFRTYFLNADGYLNDVVIPGESVDDSIRPNQVYVLSLPFRLLNKKQETKVLKIVSDELYTPYGLRTLNETHPDFKPVYKGDAWERDHAYHQGTIWPFMLGDYFTAWLRIHGGTPKNRALIAKEMELLQTHFYEEGCLHGVSEIFDGGDPGDERGTIQQAWSIGALLKMAKLASAQ
ncbi:MAG: glycogen debranching protein [Bacteroidetes bacterium]|jgi:predicted glycogen debranching enzyme|nr:glycogen debranching protein [Bacteroidota bacterium]